MSGGLAGEMRKAAGYAGFNAVGAAAVRSRPPRSFDVKRATFDEARFATATCVRPESSNRETWRPKAPSPPLGTRAYAPNVGGAALATDGTSTATAASTAAGANLGIGFLL